MSLKNAWLGLTGKLPLETIVEVEKVVEKEVTVEVVKEAIGQAAAIQLFGFTRLTGKKVLNVATKTRYTDYMNSGLQNYADIYKDYMDDETEVVYAFTCEQAHTEANGATVTATPCIKVGDQYFQCAYVKPVKTLPKPKVAKGRK